MATVDQSSAAPALTSTLPRVTTWDQIKINLFWFANNVHWIALISVVIPAMVGVYYGDSTKEANLPLVVVGGTIAAFFVNPLTGSLSDYVTLKLGRRRPFMIAGTVFNVLTLLAFGYVGSLATTQPTVPSIALMAVLFLALQVSNNFANAPWSAIIADQIPASQRGSASGWFGIMTLFGTIVGTLYAGSVVKYGKETVTDALRATFAHQIFIFFIGLAVIQTLFVIVTVLSVHETTPVNVPTFAWGDFLRRFRLETRRYPDFTWVLFTRVLVMTGIWSVNNFLLYYFTDVLKDSNASQTVSFVFYPIVLGTSMITTIVGGILSDRYGRKIMVYLSGAMMTLTCFFFILAAQLDAGTAYSASLIAAAFFGLGYGAYTSVDWALATDVLPAADQYGKDMGIWSAAGIIPQVIGVVLGGTILSVLRGQGINPHTGYSVLFGLVFVLFGLGTVLVRQVKGAR